MNTLKKRATRSIKMAEHNLQNAKNNLDANYDI